MLVLCMALTVLFDMVIAITVGIVLASLLFMGNVARMTRLSELPGTIANRRLVLRINGPLFFAAAERLFNELMERAQPYPTVILQWDAVSVLDAGGLNAFRHFVELLPPEKQLIITDIPFQPLKTLARAKVTPIANRLVFYATLEQALAETTPHPDALES
ncbi:C4-dicarboxylic acid transporter DauA [Dickeya solani]|nr:C4-dicarboxylic acid transporter DauA [Dickeya solani]